jgi:hypothetical protein
MWPTSQTESSIVWGFVFRQFASWCRILIIIWKTQARMLNRPIIGCLYKGFSGAAEHSIYSIGPSSRAPGRAEGWPWHAYKDCTLNLPTLLIHAVRLKFFCKLGDTLFNYISFYSILDWLKNVTIDSEISHTNSVRETSIPNGKVSTMHATMGSTFPSNQDI